MDVVSTSRSTFVNINSNPLYRLWAGMRDYLGIFRNFKAILQNTKYDVVHLTSSASWSLIKDVYMLRSARQRGAKTVIHFRFGRIPELFVQKTWEYKLLLKVLSLSDRIMVIDKASFDILVNAGYTNVVNQPNPLSPEVSAFVEEHKDDLERAERLLLFAGHVVPTKGVFELIEACKNIPNIHLKLIGTIYPGIKEKLLQLAEKNGDSSWVEICGEKPYEEVLTYMMTCSVFVLPTYTEGFPNVILESMACGCPIVTTPVGAIPEMLNITSPDKCGLCVPVQDVHALKESIELLLHDSMLAQELGKKAQERVNTMYNMQAIWNGLTDVWKSLL